MHFRSYPLYDQITPYNLLDVAKIVSMTKEVQCICGILEGPITYLTLPIVGVVTCYHGGGVACRRVGYHALYLKFLWNIRPTTLTKRAEVDVLCDCSIMHMEPSV